MARSGSSEQNDDFNLEKRFELMKTTWKQARKQLGFDEKEPTPSVPVGRSVFMFDASRDFVFNGAVIMDDSFGFFGIEVGSKWLAAAEHLESQGFVQAENAERFTRPGEQFGVSVYLYPDDYNKMSSAKVDHYSLNIRHGSTI